MFNNRRLAIGCGAAVLLGLMVAASGSAASSAAQTTLLTFNRAVGLPGVTLGAGTYVFERAAPGTAPNVVRVMSHDRKRVLFLGFTETVTRPHGLRDTPVTFSEAPAGQPLPITAWYPTGWARGHKFIYR